jgi:hypothetical protein
VSCEYQRKTAEAEQNIPETTYELLKNKKPWWFSLRNVFFLCRLKSYIIIVLYDWDRDYVFLMLRFGFIPVFCSIGNSFSPGHRIYTLAHDTITDRREHRKRVRARMRSQIKGARGWVRELLKRRKEKNREKRERKKERRLLALNVALSKHLDTTKQIGK